MDDMSSSGTCKVYERKTSSCVHDLVLIAQNMKLRTLANRTLRSQSSRTYDQRSWDYVSLQHLLLNRSGTIDSETCYGVLDWGVDPVPSPDRPVSWHYIGEGIRHPPSGSWQLFLEGQYLKGSQKWQNAVKHLLNYSTRRTCESGSRQACTCGFPLIAPSSRTIAYTRTARLSSSL